jgi:Tol biopolymer transport system component
LQRPHHLVVAAIAKNETRSQLYLFSESSNLMVPLTTLTQQDARNPAWSPALPDGSSRIAFTAGTGQTFGDRLILVKPDGTSRLDVTPPGARAIGRDVVWSRDGSRLAFLHQTTATTWALDVVRSDGTGRVQLASPGSIGRPVFSPDGSKVAFKYLSAGGFTLVVVADADGSRQSTSLPPGALGDSAFGKLSDPVWTDGGAHLEYLEAVDQPGRVPSKRGLYRVDPDGSNRRRVHDLPDGVWTPRLSASPDGTRLALTDEEGVSLHLMAADGTGDVAVPIEASVFASWYPAGDRVLVSDYSDLYNVDARTGSVVHLSPPGGGVYGSHVVGGTELVSRDGARIAFVAQYSHKYPHLPTDEAVSMHSDGSSATRLTQGMKRADGVAWGP